MSDTKPDWVPTIVVTGDGGRQFEVFINDSKHFDDFEPCRIVCSRCGYINEAMRGEIIVMCMRCMAFNRGYGTNESGDPIV
jgi:hypothetical protein